MAIDNVRINGAKIVINDKIDLQFNNIETLNNATLTFDIAFDVEFMEWDEVVIGGMYYFYLAEWDKDQLNSESWRYTFNLVNPVIKLQHILLPNRAIEVNREVGLIFDRFIEIYLNDKYTMDDKLVAILDDAVTTQKTWSKPTLYEVFNDLLQVKNAIITMTDFYTLSCIELDKRGDDMSDLDIVKIKTKSDFLNNAPIFRSDLQNAISDNYITEDVVFTTLNEPLLNDKNFALHLRYPIENIIEIKYHSFYNDGVSPTVYRNKDLKPMLVEKTVYDSYLASNSLGTISGDGFKRNKIWYETGSNVIGGFDYDDNTWFPIINISKPSYDYWGFNNVPIYNGINQGIFTIKYVAQMDNISVDMIKNAMIIEDKVKYVNQNEPFIDMDNFAKKQRLELDRSGELEIEIYGDGQEPKLTDYYQDFNIYSLTITYDGVLTSWYANAKRGFSYNNLSTAISSEKIFTSIQPASKAFLSNHITNINFEFSDVKETIPDEYLEIVKYFTFKNEIFNSYVMVFVDGWPFILTPLLEKYGNSLVIFYRFKDNYSAGLGFKYKENLQREIPYAINGTFSSIGFNLYDSELVNDYYLSFDIPLSQSDNLELISAMKELPALDPLLHENIWRHITSLPTKYESPTLPRYKTEREATAETTQFNLLSNEIVIVWDEYFKDIAWSESRYTFDKSNYEVRYNVDANRKYSKMDWNFGSLGLNWEIMDDGFYFTGANYTGLVIINKFDNKPVLAYNGISKALYLIEAKKRIRNDYHYISDEFRYVGDYILGLEMTGSLDNASHSSFLQGTINLNVDTTGYVASHTISMLEVTGQLFNASYDGNFLQGDILLSTFVSRHPASKTESMLEITGALFNDSYGGNYLQGVIGVLPNINSLKQVNQSYGANLNITGALFNESSDNFLQGTINLGVTFNSEPTHNTIDPSVNNARCLTLLNRNGLYFDITNNDNMSVTIYSDFSPVASIPPNTTSRVKVQDINNTPYGYSVTITAQASGKLRSSGVYRIGTVSYCTVG